MTLFPIIFSIGGYKISMHAICEVLAFTIGFRYFLYLRSKASDQISEENRIWIIIGATAGAFVGSRLLGILEDPMEFDAERLFIAVFASKTIVGGLLGGLAGVELIKLILKEKSSSGDLFTFPLILAMIIGRVGCFSSGVSEPTFGVETKAMTGMDLGDGLSRHPVVLYEIVFLVVLWFALILVEKKFLYPSGFRFRFFMIAYLVFRFLVEFIKPMHEMTFGLSVIQIACLFGLVYYAKTICILMWKPNPIAK